MHSGVYKSQGRMDIAVLQDDQQLPNDESSTPTLVPVYAAKTPLDAADFLNTSKSKGIIDKALDVLDTCEPQELELLPEAWLQQHGLKGLTEALKELHQPSSLKEHDAACRRLAFQVHIHILALIRIHELHL